MAGSWITFLAVLCAVCGSLGVRIINCYNNNKVEIFEDSPAPVTCGGIYTTADVVWRRGDGVNIGECKADGTCTSNLYNDYTLSRSPQSTESQLTLVPDYRRHAGLTVTCQAANILPTASCTLVIRRHSNLSECHVTTNPVDGTVSGSCRVQQAFSSDNKYSCSWKMNDEQQTFGGFDNNNRERCSFTNKPLPQEEGVYTFTIAVFPPPTTGFSQTVTTGSVFTPVTLSATPNVTEADHYHELSGSLVWIIVGVVAAVAVVVILITVIAIVINRRKNKFHGVTKGKPSNKEYDDFEEHINVVYHPADGQCQQVTDSEQHYYSTPFDVTSKLWSASTTPTDITDKEGVRHVTALYD